MGRLIIRLLAFPLAAEVYWRHGILTHVGRYERVTQSVDDTVRWLSIHG